MSTSFELTNILKKRRKSKQAVPKIIIRSCKGFVEQIMLKSTYTLHACQILRIFGFQIHVGATLPQGIKVSPVHCVCSLEFQIRA